MYMSLKLLICIILPFVCCPVVLEDGHCNVDRTGTRCDCVAPVLNSIADSTVPRAEFL